MFFIYNSSSKSEIQSNSYNAFYINGEFLFMQAVSAVRSSNQRIFNINPGNNKVKQKIYQQIRVEKQAGHEGKSRVLMRICIESSC